MAGKTFSNLIAFDDAPFDPDHRGDVPVVGAVYAGLRLDGFLTGKVRRDGANSTRNLIALVEESKYREHLQLLLLQGIALAGFNVVDVHTLSRRLGLPVLVVARRQPNLASIREALLGHVPGGARKWALIQRLEPMEACGPVFVQRVGLDRESARQVVGRFAIHGHIPEPLRICHLMAGAMVLGESRGRA